MKTDTKTDSKANLPIRTEAPADPFVEALVKFGEKHPIAAGFALGVALGALVSTFHQTKDEEKKT